MRTPSWGEIEQFCRSDGWDLVRETDHSFFRKVLADGTVLETHSSFSSSKTVSANRFALILRTQLRVSAQAFWDTLRTGETALRPSAPLPDMPPSLPAWLLRSLKREVGLTDDDTSSLSEVAAHQLLIDHRSSPGSTSERHPTT
ncbi:MAG: hypothetical protein ABI352_09520 [Candidatus Dormibacter sp.]